MNSGCLMVLYFSDKQYFKHDKLSAQSIPFQHLNISGLENNNCIPVLNIKGVKSK